MFKMTPLFGAGVTLLAVYIAVVGAQSGEDEIIDDITTLEPTVPLMDASGIGEDHLNVTWQPGPFNKDEPRPMGTSHYFKYRPADGDEGDWRESRPVEGNFTVMLPDLRPGTVYRVVAVSVQTDPATNRTYTSDSEPHFYTTKGEAPSEARIWWFLLLILLIILIILIILCLICLLTRHRGAKYPVSEKEKQQGREPMLSKEERGFGEYTKPDTDEKKSLTGSKAESIGSDSLAEYGDGEGGRFTEDGSFIGQYVKNKVLVSTAAAGEPTRDGKNNVSTFV